jgi:hypothetical protein
MGRPFQEKYAGIQWEVDQSKFEAWRDGKTGYPIVDAVRLQSCRSITNALYIYRQSMRQLKAHGEAPLSAFLFATH